MTRSSKCGDTTHQPALEICYLNGSQDITVNAYDEAVQAPASVNVSLTVNGAVTASGTTNESGIWDRGSWWPSTGGAWTLGAVSAATSDMASGSTSTVFGLQFPTSMVSLDSNNENLPAGLIVSNFSLSSDLFNVSGEPINFCVNGTYSNGTVYQYSGGNTTLYDGSVSFAWTANSTGTFSVHASFAGDQFYAPCDAYSLATVNTLPLSVLFSVSQTEFAPGAPLTLNATIMDPLTDKVSTHNVYVDFIDTASDGSKTTLACISSSGSILYNLPHNYPNDGKAHAYSATIVNCTDPGVASLNVSNVVSSPVQLTVGLNTTLSLDVSQDVASSPSMYMVQGYLINCSTRTGLGDEPVTLEVNNTVVQSLPTDNGDCPGYFCFNHCFAAVKNENTTYMVAVSFDGTTPLNAAATSSTPDGTGYNVSTTNQFGYQPSGNYQVLTVGPQSYLTAMLTETPDQMQQDAGKTGWLTIYNEWSSWYPWYRLHIKVNLDPTIDVGFDPILPGGNTCHFDSLNVFAQIVKGVWGSVVLDTGMLLFTYVAAKWLSWTPAWIAIEIAKNLLQAGFLAAQWNQRDAVLALSLVCFFMGTVAASGVDDAKQFVKLLYSLTWLGPIPPLNQALSDMMNVVAPVSFFHSEVDIVEVVSDFTWGAFALAHYAGIV